MNFDEALEILEIEDFKNDILRSNSKGHTFHLADYIELAKWYEPQIRSNSGFRDWFIMTVEIAKKNWERPESIYQHIPQALDDYIKQRKHGK